MGKGFWGGKNKPFFPVFSVKDTSAKNKTKNGPAKRFWSIRYKVILLVAFMMFFTVAALSTSGFFLVYNMRSQAIGESIQMDARLASEALADAIEEKMKALRVYFADPEWKEFLQEVNAAREALSPEEREAYFKKMDLAWPGLDAGEWEQALNGPMSVRLKNYASEDDQIAEIFVTDRYGGLVAASGKTTDFFQADETWWQDASKGEKGLELLRDVSFDESSGILALDMTTSIKDKKGNVIGFAKQSVNTEEFFKLLDHYTFKETGHAVLLNSYGDVLFHEGVNPLSVKVFDEKTLQKVLYDKRGWIMLPGSSLHRHKILVGRAKVDFSALETGSVQWYVITTLDEKEFFHPLKRVIAILSLSGSAFFLFFFLLGYFLSKKLVDPTRQLHKAILEVQKGNWDYPLEIHTGDEVEELADSFRALIKHLRQRQLDLAKAREEVEALSQSLEEKIEARTQDLSQSQRATMNIMDDLAETNEKIKKQTEELERNRELLNETGEMAKVGGWEVDLATQASTWTDETYRIHELEIGHAPSLQEAIGFYAPESRPILVEAVKNAMEEGQPFDLELEIIPVKTKKRLWVRASGKPIYERGKIFKLRGTFQDIDVRKRTEIELKKQKSELETQSWGLQKANEGIKALYQELEAKSVKLEKLDKMKDEFVSVVAHELRSPLSVIHEAAALIMDGLAGPVSEQQKGYIEMVRRTADRLIHITNDLLDLAKIEAGKIVLNFEPMDIISAARQACEGSRLRANKKGLEIREEFPAERLQITADYDKLSQVMVNLLTNAVKFTQKGSVTFEIKDLGGEVQCAVRDTGPGIAEENLSRLFNKFEQFGTQATSGEKGTGLGLVISKGIVEAHGGRIWAESQPGKGSSFIFVVPKQPKRKRKLGEILVEDKTLTPEQLDEALRRQKEHEEQGS